MCLGGLFVAIELKTDEGKLDKLQIYNLEKIGEIGGISIVLTPSNLDETMDFLERIAEEVSDKVLKHIIIN